MADLKIVRLGHPALRAVSKPVAKSEIKTDEFQNFLDKLAVICDKHEGVGIAAPQVGVNKRVIIVHVDPTNSRYKNKSPFARTYVINPKLVTKSKELVDDWEGDLSCGFRAVVPRAETCVVTGLDRNGKSVRFELENPFHARVFQHEIDHLDGKFFVDHVSRYETISEVTEWKKYWRDKKI